MKIFNTVVVFDVYTIANSPEEARDAAVSFIKDGLKPSEQIALEVREQKNIRAAWINERPIVAGDISDEDFETLKGKNTGDVFAMLHEKDESK